MMNFSIEELYHGILEGNKRMIAKAITLIESRKPEHRTQAEKLLEKIIPHTGKSIRVGVTGVPGAGKSTFIEHFGKLAIAQGKKLAVLAIDPSSNVNKGSILGDKTRMEELSKDPNAFIRPSPSSGFLGGIANTTYETLLICEAAGYDYILIETVGVGQSEVLVADITDVFLFIKIIGGGDELQGIKRGIMEMVDLVFINKVEDENIQKAKLTKTELKRAFNFLPNKEKNWNVPIILGSALENKGLQDAYDEILNFVENRKKNNNFDNHRKKQADKRFDFWIQAYILSSIEKNKSLEEEYTQHKQNVIMKNANPSSEAKYFVQKLLNNKE